MGPMRKLGWIGALVFSPLAAFGGCSSSDPSSPAPAIGGDAEAPDAAPIGESVTFAVMLSSWQGDVRAPLPDATVVFDKPGGERVEAKAGADGLVTFTGIDWSLGTAALTCFGPNAVVRSYVALTKAEMLRLTGSAPADVPSEPKRDLTVVIGANPPVFPKLRGTVTNGSGDEVLLTATSGGTNSARPPSAPYELGVGGGVPFSLIGLESSPVDVATVSGRGRELTAVRWTKTDRPALTADATFDLDLAAATALTPTKAKGKVVIPGGTGGVLGGSSRANLIVTTRDSVFAAALGVTTKADVDAAGDFEAEIELVKLDAVKPVLRTFLELADGARSIADTEGWPSDGFVVDNLLAPPVVVETSRSLTEPFAVDGIQEQADISVSFTSSKGELLWRISAPPGTKSFTPPRLEGAMKNAVGKPVSGVVVALAGYDRALGSFARLALSRPFAVK